ncbi:MAG TPA: ATP-binding protein [Vicinamibacterales bacterium]|nr:ATP-binding protein [Vicinamibacterales bacterium]
MTRTLGHRLLVHVALRLAAATVLLGAALVVQIRAPGDFATNPFFVLIALVYGVSLAFIASLRFVDRVPWLTDIHFSIDVILVSACVALTGGISSLFTSLYVLPIVAASTIRFRRGALQVAAFGSLLFTGVVLAQYLQATGNLDSFFGITFDRPLPMLSVAQYTVGLNVFGLFAVAFLAGSLAERVRRADVQLVQASEEIADLQFFNQYVIDNLLSGLATADEQNRLLTFNRSAVLITGHSLASVVNKRAFEVLQLPREFTEGLDEDLLRARSKRMDIQYRRPDGTVIALGLAVAQLPLPDGRRGYLYTFQDVTDVKRLERDAQLQNRLAAVGEMAAGIAHEIRNPLASMSGSMQILRQKLKLSQDEAQLMDIVLRESERLNDTIRSFLAYARPQRVTVHELNLHRMLLETATLLRNSHEVGERHTINVRPGPADVVVQGDENQLRQIVWNLATNGLRAMPEGGTLTLSAFHDPARPGAAVLTVTDGGVGIAHDELEGIFQPFRGSFGKGTGLGLAIVHRIVSDYNASIDVQSQPDRGTIFRVTFPPAIQHASRALEV